MRDGRDARGAQPGNGTAAPGSERSGPGRGAGRRKEALPGAGPPPPEPPAASARAGPFPPLRSPRPGSGRPPPRSRARAPRTPNRRPRPSPPAGSAELGGSWRRADWPSSGPRTFPLPPGSAEAPRHGPHRPGSTARPARPDRGAQRAEPSPARPAPLTGAAGAAAGADHAGNHGKKPGRETDVAGGRAGRGRSPCPAAGGGAAGPGRLVGGGARGLAAARPKRSRGSRDPSDPGARHRPPRRRTPRPLLPARGVEGAAPPDPRRPRCGPGLGAGPAASGGSAAGAAPSACGLPAPAAALGPFCIRRAARIPVSRPQCPHEDETTLLPRGLHMRYRL